MSTPSGSSSTSRRHDVVDPPQDVRLTHAKLYLLVEHRDQGKRIRCSAVDPDDRDGAATTHDVDRREQSGQPVDPGLLAQRSSHGIGQQRRDALENFGRRRTVRLHPHRVDDGVGSTPGCLVAHERAEVILMAP